MADAQQEDDRKTVSGESTGDPEDEDEHLVQTPFSTKTSINDMALVVEGEKIYVSKPVLGLVSPVFRAMFELDMAEKKMDEITLPGKSLSDMIEFLLCVYPDKPKPITEENAGVLVPLFTEYQVDDRKAACEQILTQSCTEDTDIDTLFEHILMSHTYNMGDLRRRCMHLASTRNTNTLTEAGRKYALPSDVTSELWKNVTKMRDSEILSLSNILNMIPCHHTGNYELKESRTICRSRIASTISFTVSKQLKQSLEAFPSYITAIQTAIDHKFIDAENILLDMFVAEMNTTHECDTVLLMTELPEQIKKKASDHYNLIVSKKN